MQVTSDHEGTSASFLLLEVVNGALGVFKRIGVAEVSDEQAIITAEPRCSPDENSASNLPCEKFEDGFYYIRVV
jgi:hypothetical protein